MHLQVITQDILQRVAMDKIKIVSDRVWPSSTFLSAIAAPPLFHRITAVEFL